MKILRIFGKVLEKSGKNLSVIVENLFTNRHLSAKIYYDTVCILKKCIKCDEILSLTYFKEDNSNGKKNENYGR